MKFDCGWGYNEITKSYQRRANRSRSYWLRMCKRTWIRNWRNCTEGWITEVGPDVSLKALGLIESKSSNYPARTKQNVRDAQVTFWFGNTNSPGYFCTKKACDVLDVFLIENPTPELFKTYADHYEIINIAGNRKSKNSVVVDLVKAAFNALT